MNEIKFRAWDNKKKKMGKVFSLDDAAYEGFPYPFVDENGECDLNADYIVMRHTGLTDTNGDEIYEGDILFGAIPDCIIKFGEFNNEKDYADNDAGVGFYIESEGLGIESLTKLLISVHNLKIFGNIYEDKELLK